MAQGVGHLANVDAGRQHLGGSKVSQAVHVQVRLANAFGCLGDVVGQRVRVQRFGQIGQNRQHIAVPVNLDAAELCPSL